MGTLCLSAAALFHAGASVSTALTEAQLNFAILQAESSICVDTEFNWIDVYTTLNADLKYILEEACSVKAANNLVKFDMGGYSSQLEAQTILDVNLDIYKNNIKTLKDQKGKDLLNAV